MVWNANRRMRSIVHTSAERIVCRTRKSFVSDSSTLSGDGREARRVGKKLAEARLSVQRIGRCSEKHDEFKRRAFAGTRFSSQEQKKRTGIRVRDLSRSAAGHRHRGTVEKS